MSVQVAVPNPDQGGTPTVVVKHAQAHYFEQEDGHLLVRKDNTALGLLVIYAPGRWVSALQA